MAEQHVDWGLMEMDEGAAGGGDEDGGKGEEKTVGEREWVDEESDEGEDEVVREIREKPVILGSGDPGGLKTSSDHEEQKGEEEL